MWKAIGLAAFIFVWQATRHDLTWYEAAGITAFFWPVYAVIWGKTAWKDFMKAIGKR